MTHTLSALAAAEPAAGGAPMVQLVIAALIAGTMSGGVLLLAWLHRTERTTLLARAGDRIGRLEGMPGWAALPVIVALGSLLLAFIGVYWDIAIHIEDGRDEGPLANIAHYPILFGLQGLFLAGVLAMVMPKKNAYVGPSAVRIGPGWRVPAASLMLMACAVLGYAGFPADDVWHRLFGQDVTLWGPTHLMMIAGAVLCIIAIALLVVEGERAYGAPKTPIQRGRRKLSRVVLPMATMIAISLFLAEYDWGVQQYLMEWQPLILAAGAGFALVYARLWGGPGFALMAATGYAVSRFLVDGLVDVGFGYTMPMMPVFFVEALIVEAVFISAALRERAVVGPLIAGLLIGTVGFAAQYGWSHLVMPTPWSEHLLSKGLPMAIAGAIAGGLLGFLFARSLSGTLAAIGNRRLIGSLAAVVLLALGGLAGDQDYSSGPDVTVEISDAREVRGAVGDDPSEGAIREATLTARFADPADAEASHHMLITAWQGNGLVADAMDEIAPGVYRSTQPIPLGGSWKTLVRTQQGRKMLAVPVQLPADPGIPVEGHTNPGTETLTLRNELLLLQRERKPDVPAWLWNPAIAGVLGVMALFAIGLGYSAARVGLRVKRDPRPAAAAGSAPGSGTPPVERTTAAAG